MPFVQRPAVLRAVYHETLRKIRAWEMPNEMIFRERTMFRFKDAGRLIIRHNGIISRSSAEEVFLKIADEKKDHFDRFSGNSLNGGIQRWGGLYCSLQTPALVNEMQHSAGPQIPRDKQTGRPQLGETLAVKCVAKISLLEPVLAADLSLHNPGVRDFFDELG